MLKNGEGIIADKHTSHPSNIEDYPPQVCGRFNYSKSRSSELFSHVKSMKTVNPRLLPIPWLSCWMSVRGTLESNNSLSLKKKPPRPFGLKGNKIPAWLSMSNRSQNPSKYQKTQVPQHFTSAMDLERG